MGLKTRKMKTDPIKHEAIKKQAREYYYKTKTRQQYKKKLKAKEKREKVISILGSKCMSCGEPYNSHLVRSNLEIDHIIYVKSKEIKKDPVAQVLDIVDKKIADPNTMFSLLCHTCHMIVTNVRRNQEKAKSSINYLLKNGTLKL